jgi:hypothetical protein
MLAVSLVALAGAMGLAACSVSADDFARDGEAYLRSDDVFDAYGINFTDPVCTPPGSTDVGATMTCTSAGDDGHTYRFTFEIVAEGEMSLTGIDFAD